jgi:hypothetical protein
VSQHLFCLHPDRVESLKDEVLSARFNDAFDLFTKLEKLLLDEEESPTQFSPIPRTYDEMMKARAEVMARRRGKAAETNKAPLKRR